MKGAALRVADEDTKTRETAGQTAALPRLVPQPHGGALLTGGQPGNRGGRRYKDDTIEQLGELIAEKGPAVVRQIMTGLVEYEFRGICTKCGQESEEPLEVKALLEALSHRTPSPDTRLRSVEVGAKIAWGEKTTVELVSPDVRERLLATIDVLVREFGDDHPIIEAVSQVWG